MSSRPSSNQPIEHPRAEPEVIPPDKASGASAGRRSWAWTYVEIRDGERRITITRPGRFATAVTLLTAGAIAPVLLTFAFATALMVVPLIVLAAGLLLLSDRIRSLWHRSRG